MATKSNRNPIKIKDWDGTRTDFYQFEEKEDSFPQIRKTFLLAIPQHEKVIYITRNGATFLPQMSERGFNELRKNPWGTGQTHGQNINLV